MPGVARVEEVEFAEVDELFVIADLLLGPRGVAGPAVHRENADALELGGRASALLGSLAQGPARTRTLVIAGGLFDLPADAALRGPLDGLAAPGSASAEVLAALGAFVAVPGHSLVILCGHRDLALTLPATQRWLLAALGCDAAARGRVQIVLDGAGWTARVGERRVLVVQGGEVDESNALDPAALAQLRRAATRGLPLAGPAAEALGPMARVCEALRARDPWLELLLPATARTIPLLSAWFPDQRSALARARAHTRAPASLGLLGSGRARATREGEGEREASKQDARALLWRASRSTAAGVNPRRQPITGMLGAFGHDAGASSTGPALPERRALAEALREWADRQRRGLSTHDSLSDALDASTAPSVDVLIAGHGRVPRVVERRRAPGRAYLNAGAWVPRLSAFEAGEDTPLSERCELLAKALVEHDRRALAPFLIARPTLARVDAEHAAVCAVDELGALSPLAQLPA